MLELKTVLLIFGIVFLALIATRQVLRKQRPASSNQVGPAQASQPGAKPRMTEKQFNKTWKSLSPLMLLAAAGNLYMAYNAIRGALGTGSYVLWFDAVLCLIAAVVAVLVWRLHRKSLVLAYLVITVIPIMFFLSTGHSRDGLVHLFPLVLMYIVVKPVWDYID